MNRPAQDISRRLRGPTGGRRSRLGVWLRDRSPDRPAAPVAVADAGSAGAAGPTGRTCLAMLGLYAAALVVATYPMVALIGTRLPSNVDPVQHLTVMRWTKACLLEGRSPFVVAGLQHPIGAPVGLFSPMLLPTAGYIALSTVTANDVLCYNLLWFAAFLLAGMGTFVLASRVVGDTPCAGFAGLAAMLSGPLMLHAHGHLELMSIGWFPLFLGAWMRLVDRPGRRAVVASAALYGLMTLSAGYFAVLALVPAVWYLAGEAIAASRRGDRSWLRGRLVPLAEFAALVLPIVAVAFAGQLWNVAHGLGMDRSRADFDRYGVPWYGYVVPTALHPLQRVFGVEWYDSWGYSGVECGSYLGVATLGLIAVAAIRRVGPRRPAFWWSLTALLVVLSFGASVRVGSLRLPLPASTLHDHVFLFRLLRAPARFNLFVAVAAAILAASGLQALTDRWRRPEARWATCGAVAVLTVADLAMVPFGTQAIREQPSCYARVLAANPSATFLDAPLRDSGLGHPLTAATGYWQATHRARTTGGYSGIANVAFNDRMVHNTPFAAAPMDRADYLADPDAAACGIVAPVRFLDYAWLYLAAHDLRYVVLHRESDPIAPSPAHRDRLEELLGPSLVAADAEANVYDREALPTPLRPVVICLGGWHGARPDRPTLIAARVAEVAAYNPDPTRELSFTLAARAFRQARTVRLRAGGVNLATWSVRPDVAATRTSPPFRLPAGRQTLSIESDGAEAPRHRNEQVAGGDDRPYSLFVTRISLQVADPALR